MSVLRVKRREGWLLQVTATYIVEVMFEGVEAGACRSRGTVQSQVNRAFFFLSEHRCHRANCWAISAALFLFKGLWGHLVPRAYYTLSCDLTLPSTMSREEYNGVSYIPHWGLEKYITHWERYIKNQNCIQLPVWWMEIASKEFKTDGRSSWEPVTQEAGRNRETPWAWMPSSNVWRTSIASGIGTPKIHPDAQPHPWPFGMVTGRNAREASQQYLAEARVTFVAVDCEGFWGTQRRDKSHSGYLGKWASFHPVLSVTMVWPQPFHSKFQYLLEFSSEPRSRNISNLLLHIVCRLTFLSFHLLV